MENNTEEKIIYLKTKRGEVLDLDKPIRATSSCRKYHYILLPVSYEESYGIRGYDWFNITEGRWNSCVCWKTKEEAVEAYSGLGLVNFEWKGY